MANQSEVQKINEKDFATLEKFLVKDNKFKSFEVGSSIVINSEGFVTSLDLTGVKTLSHEVSNLSMLESIDINALGFKGVQAVPETFSRLKRLRVLRLHRHCMKEFPKAVMNIPNLEELSLGENNIAVIPAIHMPKLKHLDLRYNKIASVDNIGEAFPNLTYLNLVANPFTQLHKSIGLMSHLTKFCSSKGKLKTLPEEFFDCKSLNTIELVENSIGQLSPKIKNLKKLKELYLGKNKLTELPAEITECTELELLSVSSNLLKKIPALNELKALKKLNLSGNKLAAIDEKILSIEGLNYSNNPCSGFTAPEKILEILKSEPYKALLQCEAPLKSDPLNSAYSTLALKALDYIINDYEEHGDANKDMNGNKPASYFKKYKADIEKQLSTKMK